MHFIGVLALILVATTVAGHFSKRIGIPAVIGQLLVGILLGEGGLQWVHSDAMIQEFSELGVILLMFLAGIESDLVLLKKYFRPAMLVAGLGILLPIALGAATGTAIGLSQTTALFIGIILAATSVSVSVEVLKELRVVDTKEGTTILGASVIDDILTIFLVSFSLAFFGSSNQGSNVSMGFMIIEQIAYFFFIYLLVKWIAPFLMRLSEKLFVASSVIIVSLVICLMMAYFADLVGLSAVIGAFFAGIAVGQTTVKEVVYRNTEALGYSLFIPVFFVSIGLTIEFTQLREQLFLILSFLFIAIFSKLFGGFLGARMSRFSKNSSLMIGAGMISRGEMALIILQLGSQAGLLEQQYYSALVIVILLTTLLSPLILKYFTQKIYKKSYDRDSI